MLEACEATLRNALLKLRPKELPIDMDAVGEVFSRYFEGRAPYSKAKEREDIPDAFVFAACKQLVDGSASGVDVDCVVADKRLGKALRDELGCRWYESLHALVKSEPFVEKKKELNWFNTWVQKFSALEAYLQQHGDSVAVAVDEEIDTELYRGGIDVYVMGVLADVSYTGICSTTIEWKKLEDGGPGVIFVPFAGKVDAEVSFVVDPQSVSDLPDWAYLAGQGIEEGPNPAIGETVASYSGEIMLEYDREDVEKDIWGTPAVSVEVDVVSVN